MNRLKVKAIPTSAATIASTISIAPTPAPCGVAGRGDGRGLFEGAPAVGFVAAAAGAAAAWAAAGAGAAVGAAGIGAAAGEEGAPPGAGILIVGDAAGFGGSVILTVSFFPAAEAASAGLGGAGGMGAAGFSSAINLVFAV